MCLRQMTFTACRALSTGIIRWIASMAPPDAPAVAQLLVEFGHRTALHGGNPYRARAYYKAAENLHTVAAPLKDLVRQDRLREIPGAGNAIADIILKLHETGTHPALLAACAQHGVAVEINANPWRLDLDWRWHGRALELGCMMSINPDAHSISELDLTHWGVEMARKGGVPRERVLNWLDLREIAKFFEQRKSGTIPANARTRRHARAHAGSRRSRSSPIKSAPKRPAGRPTPRALKMKQR
jgi:hypothetical protein